MLGTATVTAPEEGRDDWCGDAGKSRFRSTAEHQGTQWSDLVVSGDTMGSVRARARAGLDWRGELELEVYLGQLSDKLDILSDVEKNMIPSRK